MAFEFQRAAHARRQKHLRRVLLVGYDEQPRSFAVCADFVSPSGRLRPRHWIRHGVEKRSVLRWKVLGACSGNQTPSKSRGYPRARSYPPTVWLPARVAPLFKATKP